MSMYRVDWIKDKYKYFSYNYVSNIFVSNFRIRVEHMERQLANLTGLVQKALTQAPTPTPREFLQVPPGSTANYRNYFIYIY